MRIKQTLTHHLVNLPGWHTGRKILIIESDDWGSIRTPSKQAYEALIREGIPLDRCPYSRYDSLASAADLEALFEVLQSVRDKSGRAAKLTANCVTYNPDFEKIKDSLEATKGQVLSIQEVYGLYSAEPITKTMERYGDQYVNSFSLWKQGIEEGIFQPQFHGREHLNVRRWLEALRREDRVMKMAFDHQMWGLSKTVIPTLTYSYMDAFDSALSDDLAFYHQAISEGLDDFERYFGFRSRSFIATRYTWSPWIERSLKESGVRYLQGMVQQKCPRDQGEGFYFRRTNFLGTKSTSGLIYLSRNVFFEPSVPSSFDWLSEAKRRIKIAFLWGKPAVVCSHRMNYMGSLYEKNRTHGLQQLRLLLQWVVKEFPEVEFLTSDELGSLIDNNHL